MSCVLGPLLIRLHAEPQCLTCIQAYWLAFARMSVDCVPASRVATTLNQLGASDLDKIFRSSYGRALRRRFLLCPICEHWVAKPSDSQDPAGHMWCRRCHDEWVRRPKDLVLLADRLQGDGHESSREAKVSFTKSIVQCIPPQTLASTVDALNSSGMLDVNRFLLSECGILFQGQCFLCPMCDRWRTNGVVDRQSLRHDEQRPKWCTLCAHDWARRPFELVKLVIELQADLGVCSREAKVLFTSCMARALLPDTLAESVNRLDTRGTDQFLQSACGTILQEKCFLCLLCQHWRSKSWLVSCQRGCVDSGLWTGSGSPHFSCEDCISKWAEDPAVIRNMRQRRELTIMCPFRPCDQHVALEDVFKHVQRGPALNGVIRDMQQRRNLIARAEVGGSPWVDCRRRRDPVCLGIAYRGERTEMCFVCEDQWFFFGSSCGLAALRRLAHICQYFCETRLDPTANRRRCPGCRIMIEKIEGCNHMTCTCGAEFDWTTGMPYRCTAA